jgi:hypothetical protein
MSILSEPLFKFNKRTTTIPKMAPDTFAKTSNTSAPGGRT